jgi:Flp pilus assembly pilin Flp
MRLRRGGWLAQDSGQGMVEYAVILALASVGIVVALLVLQDSIGGTFQGTAHEIDAVAGGPPEILPGQPLGGGGTETGYGSGHHHGRGNGKGNSGYGNGNGGPNGRKQ